MLESKDCQCVQALKNKLGPIGKGSSNAILSCPQIPAYIEIFTCCSEKHSSKKRVILKTLTEIRSAKQAVHGIFVEFHSLMECIIQIEGQSKTGQISFEDSHGNPTSNFYCEGQFPDAFGSSVTQSRCGEIFSNIHKKMNVTAGDETIMADVSIHPSYPTNPTKKNTYTNYQISICP